MIQQFLKSFPAEERRITLATLCTILRIFLVPCIVAAMFYHSWGLAWGLLAVALLTDIADGMLARLRNERTILGACLDPIADKFLLIACFVTLASIETSLYAIPIWLVLLVLIKELLILVGTGAMYAIKGFIHFRPTFLAKAAGGMQLLFIAWLMCCQYLNRISLPVYNSFLVIVACMVVAVFIQYLITGIRLLQNR
ncbi:MAG TPA: CDP-alcohol phosphatidyltransferase family protein [Candidatus Babeliales bacterium]|nr:CDP-alcohol phosphatidyltransferase family protein [Candidatus Babeliales bacterium]